MDISLFKTKIRSSGYTQRSLSSAIGINENTLYNKMKKNSFGISDVESIAKLLKLSEDDIIQIFFRNWSL